MLARGDEILLFALLTYRYLRTAQLARIAGRSGQVVRRRMRELAALGYVAALARDPMTEQVYSLGVKGWEHVAKRLETTPEKLPYSAKNAVSAETLFLKHTLLTNDVRISVELALADHPHAALRRSVPEWEIVNPEAQKPAEKFALAEDFSTTKKGKKRTVRFRPDCLFLVYPRAQGPKFTAALFLESDRHTESVAGKIREKFLSYQLYYQQGRYCETWGAGKMRCLFVIQGGNVEKRIARMQEELHALADELGDPTPVEGTDSPAAFVHCFRFADAIVVSEKTIIDDAIWQDWQGQRVTLFRKPQAVSAPEEKVAHA
jgi:hypothetical protein